LEEKENGHKKHKRARKEDRYFVAVIHDRGVGGEGFLDHELTRMEEKVEENVKSETGSPLDVKGIDLGVTTSEIVDVVRESRSRYEVGE